MRPKVTLQGAETTQRLRVQGRQGTSLPSGLASRPEAPGHILPLPRLLLHSASSWGPRSLKVGRSCGLGAQQRLMSSWTWERGDSGPSLSIETSAAPGASHGSLGLYRRAGTLPGPNRRAQPFPPAAPWCLPDPAPHPSFPPFVRVFQGLLLLLLLAHSSSSYFLRHSFTELTWLSWNLRIATLPPQPPK